MSCNNIAEELLVGEKRWLEFKVSPCGTTPQYFEILSATYAFGKIYSEGDIIAGDCIVDNTEKTIKCLIEATEKGSFMITFTWNIADEIFKEKVRIEVC